MLFVTWSQSPGSSHLSSGGSQAFSQAEKLGHQTDNIHGAKRARAQPAPLSNCTQASQNIAEGRDKISSHFQKHHALMRSLFGKSHWFSKHPPSSLDQAGRTSMEKAINSHADFP